jgi:hypothetical protein
MILSRSSVGASRADTSIKCVLMRNRPRSVQVLVCDENAPTVETNAHSNSRHQRSQ